MYTAELWSPVEEGESGLACPMLKFLYIKKKNKKEGAKLRDEAQNSFHT